MQWSGKLRASLSWLPGLLRRRWLLVFAVSMAAIFQVIIAVRSEIIAPDGVLFIQIAKDFADDPLGTFRVEPQHPGYPAAVLGLAKLLSLATQRDDIHVWILAGRLVAGVCGLGCVILVWLLAARLFSERIANLAAVIFAWLPLVRQNAADVLSDSPHLLCYLAASWAVAQGLVRKSLAWWVLAGVSSGLAFWIRPEGLGAAIAAALALLAILLVRTLRLTRASTTSRPPISTGRTAGGLVLLATSAAIVVLPYVLLAGRLTSKKTLAVSAATWKLGTLKTARRGQRAQPAKVKPTAADVAHKVKQYPPLESWTGGCGELVAKLSHSLRYALVLPLLIGLAASRRSLSSTHQGLIWALVGFNVALLLGQYLYDESSGQPGYIEYRHLMPLIAVAMPCIALGSWLIAEFCARLLREAVSARTVSVGLTSFVLASMMPWTVRPLWEPMANVRQAAAWAKSQAEPTSLLLTNSFYVAFYSEAQQWVYRNGNKIQREAAYAKSWPGRVVIVVDTQVSRSAGLRSKLTSYDVVQTLPCATPSKPREMLMLVRNPRAKKTDRSQTVAAKHRDQKADRKRRQTSAKSSKVPAEAPQRR